MNELPAWQNTSLENLPDEIWKPITGLEGIYEISNYSRIKSKPRIVTRGGITKERILKLCFDSDKYLISILCYKNKHITVKAHRLSAIAFIPNPENKCCVNHIDGIKTNCHISNLEWNTEQENNEHAIRIGLSKVKGEDNSAAKLNNNQVLEIYNSKLKSKELAVIYKVAYLTITRIKSGYKWSHITGHKYQQKRNSAKWKKSIQ